MTEAITPEESVRLVELEAIILKHKDAVFEFGRALEEIREKKLYQSTHGSFEDYCRDKWNFGRSYVNKHIAAAKVVDQLGTIVPIPPVNEYQVRPLAKLPAEQQSTAWEKAVEIAAEEGKPVTARHVEQAVAGITLNPAIHASACGSA